MGNELDDIFEKPAGIGGAGFGVMAGLAGKAIPKETAADSERKMLEAYMDPVHDAEMARIRSQAMLNDFLANDPVISTYDPDEVLDAFNQVAQMVPRASMQAAVMRGQLRKLLQQQTAMEPFEANQLVEVEKGLKSVQEPAKLPLVDMGTESDDED